MSNYFKSGRYNKVLTQAYSYDKKKKQLLKDVNEDTNSPTPVKIGKELKEFYWNKKNQIEWRIRTFLRNIHLNNSVSKRNTWSKYGIDIHKIKDHLIKEAEQYGGYDKIRGKYHIDHIIPISLYNIKSCKEDMIACNDYRNLRWLTAEENMSKGCRIRPQDLEVIKTLPKSIYPKGFDINTYTKKGDK